MFNHTQRLLEDNDCELLLSCWDWTKILSVMTTRAGKTRRTLDALIGSWDLPLRLLMSTPGPSPPLLPKRAKSLSAACPLVSCHCHHRQPDPTKAPHTTTAAVAYLQDACKH